MLNRLHGHGNWNMVTLSAVAGPEIIPFTTDGLAGSLIAEGASVQYGHWGYFKNNLFLQICSFSF